MNETNDTTCKSSIRVARKNNDLHLKERIKRAWNDQALEQLIL
jgi:hypothetical protein